MLKTLFESLRQITPSWLKPLKLISAFISSLFSPSSRKSQLRETNIRSSKRRNSEEAWLRIAALLSIFLHLGILILLPAPGNRGTLPAQRVQVDVRFRSTPEPDPIEEQIPEPIEDPNPLEEEELVEPSPPLVEETEIPETIVDNFAEIMTPPTTAVESTAPLDSPAQPETPEEDGEIERIQSLLNDTLDQVNHDKARDRWLLLEVREPIRNGLTELLGQGFSISDAEGSGKFLLSFWIDAEGWIYDLALKPAPGVKIDAFGIRDMIARLNPLTSAPEGVKTPLKIQLRVQSLE